MEFGSMEITNPATVEPNFAPIRRSVLVSIVAPAIATALLMHYGMSFSRATIWSAIFPVAELLVGWRETRRLDAIAVISLVLLGAGLATSSASGNARLVFVKDSALTLASGLIFLLSLLLPRPLIYFVARSYMEGVSARAWDDRWRTVSAFRNSMRTMTAVWGAGLVLDAIARLAFIPAVSVTTMTLVSPAIAIVTFAALIIWTRAYVRAARSRARAAVALEN
jgi:hypothetical protein